MSTTRYQLKNKKQLELMNFHLLYITTSLYEGDWHTDLHTHHCTEIFYILNGKGCFFVYDEKIDVKADDLIIINPNVMHTEISNENEPLEYIVVGIEGLQLSAFKDNDEHEDYIIFNYHAHPEYTRSYLQLILKEMEQAAEHYEIICQNLLEVLIIHIVRTSKTKIVILQEQKVVTICRLVEQYINTHVTENITLEKLSTKFCMNKYYLAHSFKENKGVSPINYLINKRIEHAKELLKSTNYSIAIISEQTGFRSQSYFSQVFKKMMHMSPNEYRNQKE